MSARLARVTLPYATFGVDYDSDTRVITAAAPIGRWMIGKTIDEVRTAVARKGGKVEDG